MAKTGAELDLVTLSKGSVACRSWMAATDIAYLWVAR